MNVSDATIVGTTRQRMAFVLDPQDKVYISKNKPPFVYSDGEEVERRIHEILAAARDLSTTSTELRAAISDWPTEYHFSAARYNLLRHVPIKPDHAVLEIGAGCGAITRLLGETGARVVTVEGSVSRARCARLRCRDLENVEVYCSNLQDFHTETQFDIATLIGVLEYAPRYISGDDPMLGCLNLASQYLKPGGVLVVAIENQLGLKYLCGYPEDHVSVPYFGVSDLYRDRTARTFGKAELTRLFQRAGFGHVEFQYPFPDYKLPSMVFLERSFEVGGFRPEEIIRQMRSRDYAGMHRSLVPEHLIWPVIGRNGLVRELSNSFLAFATRTRKNPLASPTELLAIGYTNDRAAAYNTVKTFSIDALGDVWVMRTPAKNAGGAVLIHLARPEKYVDGTHLGSELDKSIEADDWPHFARLFRGWVAHLLENGAAGPQEGNVLETRLAPEYLDCLPKNVIVTETGFEYIDREWAYTRTLFAGTVILRFLLSPHIDARAIDFISRNLSVQPRHVIQAVLQYFEMQVTPRIAENYVDVSNTITAVVSPHRKVVQASDIWNLLSAGEPPTDAAMAWHTHVGAAIRGRFRRSAYHLAQAVRSWWA